MSQRQPPVAPPPSARPLDDELASLDAALADMGRAVLDGLDGALDALAGQDGARARAVSAADADVDAMEAHISDTAVRLLALRQPVADDLRAIVAALRCATMLERAGDYVAGAARRALADTAPPPGRSVASVQRMGREVGALLHRAMMAYGRGDTAEARAVWEADAEVDALHSSLFREMLTYMMENPRHIGVCSHLLFVAKNLERIGDQATNIAELAVYRATGEALGHGRPKHDQASFARAEDGN